MRMIKFEDKDSGSIYLNVEDIMYFFCKKSGETQINLRDNRSFIIEGDICSKLAKLISAITNGGVSPLE